MTKGARKKKAGKQPEPPEIRREEFEKRIWIWSLAGNAVFLEGESAPIAHFVHAWHGDLFIEALKKHEAKQKKDAASSAAPPPGRARG